MNLIFLSADRPLTKSYKKLPDGSIEKTSYPSAYSFTSHERSADSLTILANELTKAAKAGWCLLKGTIVRPLVAESRAGSTNPVATTEIFIHDLDGAPFTNPDEYMAAVGLADVSYVVQYSASAGFKPGLHCHIITILETPTVPTQLKLWALWKNLTVPALNQALSLTRTNVALRYPLDITANQNDKLIYLAPPVLSGVPDPFPTPAQRIQVVNKSLQKWSVPTTPATEALRLLVQDKISDLRKAAGLPERKHVEAKMSQHGVEYMPKPGEAHVTGVKQDRGFIYLNLNGGDSWGYWYPEDNPEYLYNFKGEPTYKLSEICPAYWSMLQSQVNAGKQNSFGMVYLGVCDKATASYYKITYDTATDTLIKEPARNKDMVKDFLKQHGQPVKDIIFDWTLTWNPKGGPTIDVTTKTINTFVPSEFMKKEPATVAHCPPTIKKIMLHVMGGDPDCLEHAFNKYAFILQKRERTNTADVWFGVQGTCKGVTFHYILTKIFGIHNVVAKRMEELESEFTGFMENKLLVFIDEVQVARSAWHKKVTAKLKNLIAEPFISVRRMYQDAYMCPNYSNMIFASNSRDPVELSRDDRRFNVAPYQTKPLKPTQAELDAIEAELFEFYSFLMCYQVDEQKVRAPYQNAERTNLIETSMLSVDLVSEALHAGNIEFFIDQLPQNAPVPGLQRLGISERDAKLIAYKELMRDILKNNRKNLSRDDLYTMYAYCVEDVPSSPNKFTSYLRHHNIRIGVVSINARPTRGVCIEWKMNPQVVAAAIADLT